MLLIEATLIRNAAKGTNLAEMVEGPKKRVETAQGPRLVPTQKCKYVEGLPWQNFTNVKAPDALEAGDEVKVDGEKGKVIRVVRDGVIVWQNEQALTDAKIPLTLTEVDELAEPAAVGGDGEESEFVGKATEEDKERAKASAKATPAKRTTRSK